MGDKTGIEWAEATWNPVTGCTKVSAGCKFCYAEREWARLSANPATVYFGRKFTDVGTHAHKLDQPIRWTRGRLIFVNSMSDLFHESVPFEFIDRVWEVMAATPQHRYQVLTKRAQRMRLYLERRSGLMLPNVAVGVSAEDQEAWNERVPELAHMNAAVRFVSAEPLIGEIIASYIQAIDWVIVGGESGRKAVRITHPGWVRFIREMCLLSGTPFFFKQWGEWGPAEGHIPVPRFVFPDGTQMFRRGKKRAGRVLDGQTYSEMPLAWAKSANIG